MTRNPESPLVTARGALREGLAALEAFGDLLGSRRVGPRALASARSDMGEACQALAQAMSSLERALAQHLPDDDSLRASAGAVQAFISSRVDALSSVLSNPEPIDARRRLSLEAAIRKHGAELRDAIPLVDLVAAAAEPALTELELVDVLDQRFHRFGESSADVTTIRLGIEAPRPTHLVIDRHVIGGLVEIAARFVARTGAAIARLFVSRPKEDAISMRIGPSQRAVVQPKTVLFVPVRPEVPGELEIARAVAGRSGLSLSLDGITRVATITTV